MVRNALTGMVRFLRLLRHAPPPRPHIAAPRHVAMRLRGAIGMSCNGAYGSGGNSNIDGMLGKELAEGHKQARKQS